MEKITDRFIDLQSGWDGLWSHQIEELEKIVLDPAEKTSDRFEAILILIRDLRDTKQTIEYNED